MANPPSSLQHSRPRTEIHISLHVCVVQNLWLEERVLFKKKSDPNSRDTAGKEEENESLGKLLVPRME